ncbi:MAG: MMPL family transporter [Candidatus Altiarchaeales archaeon]|nr:MMPL family transporter [Candidatus Altiarchaeales archaeon]
MTESQKPESRSQKILTRLSEIQYKHHLVIVALSLLLTGYMAVGASKVYMDADTANQFPSDIPAVANQKKIDKAFGGSDLVLVVVELEFGSDIKHKPQDIRDPRVMEMLVDLQTQLQEEPQIDRVLSAGLFFPYEVPQTLSGVRKVLKKMPGAQGMFNKDYSITLLYVYSNVGGGEQAVASFTQLIQDNIEGVAKPPGVKLSITGGPPISDTIFKILWSDAVYTLLLAASIIFLLLVVIQKSLYKGFLVFTPLLLGLTWTLGVMGHLDIPLSIATVAVGAMILGLGVEYGIFLVERYMEERKKQKTIKQSIGKAVPAVGFSILGSGLTTIVGFGMLSTFFLKFVAQLGQVLALGIACCLLAAILANPAFIVFFERITEKTGDKK